MPQLSIQNFFRSQSTNKPQYSALQQKKKERKENERVKEKEAKKEKEQEKEEKKEDEEKVKEEEEKSSCVNKTDTVDESTEKIRENVDNDLTEYERVRLENIQRNQQFLQDLGLAGTKESIQLLDSNQAVARGGGNEKKRKSKSASTPKVDYIPKRVQPRRNVKSQVKNSHVEEGENSYKEQYEGVVEEEQELDYDSSAVLQYFLSDSITKHKCLGDVEVEDKTTETLPSRLAPVSITYSEEEGKKSTHNIILQSDELTAVYSMDFHHMSPLYLAGGKGGVVAVFAIPDNTEEVKGESLSSIHSNPQPNNIKPNLSDSQAIYQPLLAFRAHQRWVSCAKFLSPSFFHTTAASDSCSTVQILTSSDDGQVKLWDAAQSSQSSTTGNMKQIARLLTTSTCGHTLGRGIFCLDELGGSILSGSKDRSVCSSQLTSDGQISPLHNFSTLHDGVVKSVSWQQRTLPAPPAVFASGGQDRRVCVKDTRCGYGGETGDIQIIDAHMGGVHSVQWCPYKGGEHLLISAGYDGLVNIYDLRFLKCGHDASNTAVQPLFTFRERHASSLHSTKKIRKSNTILTPCFLSNSRVLIPSEHSGTLSLHCLLSGDTVSRGVIDSEAVPIAVTANANSSYVVSATSRKGAMHVLRTI